MALQAAGMVQSTPVSDGSEIVVRVKAGARTRRCGDSAPSSCRAQGALPQQMAVVYRLRAGTESRRGRPFRHERCAWSTL